jgi:hypothetical protein
VTDDEARKLQELCLASQADEAARQQSQGLRAMAESQFELI